MKINQLADAIGEVREDLIADADLHPGKKKSAVLRWGGMAACICLVVAGVGFALLQDRGTAEEAPSGFVYVRPDVPQPAVENGEAPSADPSVTEPAPAPTPYPDPQPAEKQSPVNGVFLPDRPVNGVFLPDRTEIIGDPPIPMIEWYGSGARITEDLAVENGGVLLSAALQGALEEYGGRARYRVIATLFEDGVQIPGDSELANAEAERVASLGLFTAMETFQDATGTTFIFSLHLTAEQLRSFPASDQAGWLLELYDEQFDMPEPIPTPYVVYNGAVQAVQ